MSGALAGAMTKAVLAPLETIRYSLYIHHCIHLLTSVTLSSFLITWFSWLGD